MRLHLALATAATASLGILFAAQANATPVGAASGIREALAETSVIEKARRVCFRSWFTGRQVCWIDRSRPPTVCHRIRGTNRLDCY